MTDAAVEVVRSVDAVLDRPSDAAAASRWCARDTRLQVPAVAGARRTLRVAVTAMRRERNAATVRAAFAAAQPDEWIDDYLSERESCRG